MRWDLVPRRDGESAITSTLSPGTVGRDTFPANKATNSQGDCTLKLWIHEFIFVLHISLWHLFYTSFLVSVFHAHVLMMIFTLIETVTVNCHLIWLADSFDGVLVERFVCAHCHAWRLSHVFSVHCITVKWNRRLLQMLTCAVLLVEPGAARMTRSDGGKIWNSCSIWITAWTLLEYWFVAERGVCYLLSRASLMLSLYVATWGTIVQGALKRVLKFQILYVYNILLYALFALQGQDYTKVGHPNFYICFGLRNVLNQAWYWGTCADIKSAFMLFCKSFIHVIRLLCVTVI